LRSTGQPKTNEVFAPTRQSAIVVMSENPVWLIVQGRITPGEEGTYEKYLDGTRPLMEKQMWPC
jgi:hypothetical protein